MDHDELVIGDHSDTGDKGSWCMVTRERISIGGGTGWRLGCGDNL